MPISNEAIQSERTVGVGGIWEHIPLRCFVHFSKWWSVEKDSVWLNLWLHMSASAKKVLCQSPMVPLQVQMSFFLSSGPLYSFQSHREGAGCHPGVHPWMRHHLIAGFSVSIWGISAMLKGTLVVLWGCPGTSTTIWTLPMFCPNQGWNWEPSASQLRPLQIFGSNDSFKYKI